MTGTVHSLGVSSRTSLRNLISGSRFWLLAIVVLGAWLRFDSLSFGLPYAHSRPDETALAGPAVMCLIGQCAPPDFYYPTGFIYALSAVYVAMFVVFRARGVYTDLASFAESRRLDVSMFFVASRVMSALAGTATIVVVHAIGRLLWSPTVGLVSSLYLAVSLLHVRDSHFGTTDVTMTALIAATVWLILKWQQAPSYRLAMLVGLAGGVATSTKYNGLGVAVPFLLAVGLRTLTGPTYERLRPRAVAITLGIAAVAGAVAFLVLSPYAVIQWDRFVRDVLWRGDHLARPHGIDVGPGWQHHALVTLPGVMGWPLYVCSLAGVVGLLVSRFRQSIVVLSFPLAYYVVMGSLETNFARYALPLVPFMALTAGWLTAAVGEQVSRYFRIRSAAPVAAALAVLLAAPSARQVLLLNRILARPDTRVEAFEVLRHRVAPGDSIYLSGLSYAHTPLALRGRALEARAWIPDDDGRFPMGPDGVEQLPTWIVLHRSPLVLYTPVPARLENLTKTRYDRVARFAATPDGHSAVYDQQDAFFLPLWGLEGVQRIGPTVEIYRRRVS